MGTDGFPFWFFGVSPDDWFDEPVHAWQLRFVRTPDAGERARVAAAWESASRTLARGLSADFSGAWWWADAWALCPVRVGDRSRETMRALFEAMQGVLRAVHGAAPLAEVVYAQAADLSSGSAWESATLAQSPTPTELPVWPEAVTTHAMRSRKKSKAAVDEAFEAARKVARGGGVVASPVAEAEDEGEAAEEEVSDEEDTGADGAADDSAADDDAGDDDAPTKPAREPRGFKLRVEKIDPAQVREDDPTEAAANKAIGTDARRFVDETGWCAPAKRPKKGEEPRLVVYVDGAAQVTVHPASWQYAVRSWSSSRAELLVDDQEGSGQLAARLDRAPPQRVWDDPLRDGTNIAFWLAEGAFIAAGGRAWRLLPTGEGFAPGGFYEMAAEEGITLPASDGRAVVTYGRYHDGFVQVVVPVGDTLRLAGEGFLAAESYGQLMIRDGVTYLFDDDEAWRVDGIAEAVDALLAAPNDLERFPELPRAQSPAERGDPARNTDPDECLQRAQMRLDEEDLAGTEVWARRTLALRPGDIEAQTLLGRVLTKAGGGAEAQACLGAALAHWEQCAKDEPDDEEARYQCAVLLSLLGRRADCLAMLATTILPGTRGNGQRRRASADEDFAALRKDPEFVALTAKVATAKKAAKKAAKRSDDDEDEDD